MKAWLFRPSKIPNGPSWRSVFLFGALYNALWVRCWWATMTCLVIMLVLPALDRLDRKLLG